MYIHKKNNWIQFYWNNSEVMPLLEEANHSIGRLYGQLDMLGFNTKMQAVADNIVDDVIRSSEIEGIRFNTEEVRSSVARHLGIESLYKNNVTVHRVIDNVVKIMMSATQHYSELVTKEKLCAWQSALFEGGFSGGIPIETGKYRTCKEQIVSGAFGREKVHYVAPLPERVEEEIANVVY